MVEQQLAELVVAAPRRTVQRRVVLLVPGVDVGAALEERSVPRPPAPCSPPREWASLVRRCVPSHVAALLRAGRRPQSAWPWRAARCKGVSSLAVARVDPGARREQSRCRLRVALRARPGVEVSHPAGRHRPWEAPRRARLPINSCAAALCGDVGRRPAIPHRARSDRRPGRAAAPPPCPGPPGLRGTGPSSRRGCGPRARRRDPTAAPRAGRDPCARRCGAASSLPPPGRRPRRRVRAAHGPRRSAPARAARKSGVSPWRLLSSVSPANAAGAGSCCGAAAGREQERHATDEREDAALAPQLLLILDVAQGAKVLDDVLLDPRVAIRRRS